MSNVNEWIVLRYWPSDDANTAELIWVHVEEDDAAFVDGLEDGNGGMLRFGWIDEAEALRNIDEGRAIMLRGRSGWAERHISETSNSVA